MSPARTPPFDPILHTHIEDELPDTHPRAFEGIECDSVNNGKHCRKLLHAANNECMTTWVETGKGNYCIECFARIPEVFALEDEWGLKELYS